MTFTARLRSMTADLFGLTRAAAITEPTASGAYIARLYNRAALSTARALSIGSVYRAVQIIVTGGSQISLSQFTGATRRPASALLVQPSLTMSRGAFIEYTLSSLATDGNAFWLITPSIVTGQAIALDALNPAEVGVTENPRTRARDYTYQGRPVAADRIRHLELMRVPGRLRGLGPIEAARVELQGTIDARDYGSNWLSTSAVPNGILTTEQPLSPEQATQYKNAWTGYDPVTDTTTPPGHTPRVMGQGVKYEFLGIKPKDAQFLETRQFNTTEIARLFGIPASLILATVEGGSQSYANIEQDWIGFTRFTMMAYLTEIEDAFSALLPYGETAKFVIDELLRTDTKTRFEAHEIALRARFKTRNEVRADEGLAAIAGGDELDPVTAPAVAAIPRAAAGPSRPPSLAQIGA